MVRRPLAPGTWGKIRIYRRGSNGKGKPTRWKATTLYRDFTGQTRTVDRWGQSATDAGNRLKTALTEQVLSCEDGQLAGIDRFSKAAELWRAGIEELVNQGSRSPGTLETYERHLLGHILPALGDLRLFEVSVPVLDRFFRALSSSSGTATAKTARSVVSGVMGLAVRYGAILHNPVRDAGRLEGRTKREPRALTPPERKRLVLALSNDKEAIAADLPDLARFMLATGQRIGECLAVLWTEVDLDRGQAANFETASSLKVRRPRSSSPVLRPCR